MVHSGLSVRGSNPVAPAVGHPSPRSEEHTSELQSQSNIVCRLLLAIKTATKRGRKAAIRLFRHFQIIAIETDEAEAKRHRGHDPDIAIVAVGPEQRP